MDKQVRDHLVIPDSHAYPEDNFRRYEWLGQYIIDHKPEVIVDLGDRWDMASLCSYDKGKRDFVHKNVRADIEAGHKAEEIMFKPMLDYNENASKNKKKQYKPLIIKVLGNHEHRVQRLLDYEPQLDGLLSMDVFKTRLPIKEQIVPFMHFTIIDGIAYSHYFVSGSMGRAFGSARAMVGKRGMSCTMGHTHHLDIDNLVKPTGERIRGLIAGSFHDKNHQSFAGPQVDNIWWNGILHKRNVTNGDYDLEEISIERLEKIYGN